MTTQTSNDVGARFVTNWIAYKREVKKIVVGCDDILDLAGIAIFSDGHFLMEALPGAGKTTIALALSSAIKNGIGGVFQGTADLLPMDIIGSKAWDPEKKKLVKQPGAVQDTMNIVVADETNRLAPKTASSLLMVMQERVLNIQGERYPMADPFLVIGTQNPIEQEGVYPLPEALLDRFAMKAKLAYLSRDLEIELVRRAAVYARDQSKAAGIEPVLTIEQMREMRRYAQEQVIVELAVSAYMIDLVRATRPELEEFDYMPKEFGRFIDFGASQRAGLWLTACSKAHAAMRGSTHVHVEDVQAVAPVVLGHRLTLKADARFGNKRGLEYDIVAALLESVPTVGQPRQKEQLPVVDTEVPVSSSPRRRWWQIFGG